MSNPSAEPISRPRMPKTAPLDTVMFVPVRGPNVASGAMTRAPMAMPRTDDVTAPQKFRPRVMGIHPRITTDQPRFDPVKTEKTSFGLETRPSSGMNSIPACSTLPTSSVNSDVRVDMGILNPDRVTRAVLGTLVVVHKDSGSHPIRGIAFHSSQPISRPGQPIVRDL